MTASRVRDNMDLEKLIKDQITDAVIDKIAGQNGVDSSTTKDVISTGLPAILEGLKKNTGTKKGAEELDKTLDKNHDGSILNDIIGSISEQDVKADGAKILDHIFGGKTEQLEETIGTETGTNKSKAADILGTIAPIVLGQLGKTKAESGLDAGALGDLLAGQSSKKGGIFDTLNSLLDRDKDGSALDDILDIGQGLLGKKK